MQTGSAFGREAARLWRASERCCPGGGSPKVRARLSRRGSPKVRAMLSWGGSPKVRVRLSWGGVTQGQSEAVLGGSPKVRQELWGSRAAWGGLCAVPSVCWQGQFARGAMRTHWAVGRGGTGLTLHPLQVPFFIFCWTSFWANCCHLSLCVPSVQW